MSVKLQGLLAWAANFLLSGLLFQYLWNSFLVTLKIGLSNLSYPHALGLVVFLSVLAFNSKDLKESNSENDEEYLEARILSLKAVILGFIMAFSVNQFM